MIGRRDLSWSYYVYSFGECGIDVNGIWNAAATAGPCLWSGQTRLVCEALTV